MTSSEAIDVIDARHQHRQQVRKLLSQPLRRIVAHMDGDFDPEAIRIQLASLAGLIPAGRVDPASVARDLEHHAKAIREGMAQEAL